MRVIAGRPGTSDSWGLWNREKEDGMREEIEKRGGEWEGIENREESVRSSLSKVSTFTFAVRSAIDTTNQIQTKSNKKPNQTFPSLLLANEGESRENL